MAAMSDQATGSNMYAWSAAVVTDRDRGFYDNLSNLFTSWLKKPDMKKKFFDGLRLTNSAKSPYHSLVESIDKIADLQVRQSLRM